MKSVKIRLLAISLVVALFSLVCALGVFADTSMLTPEDGMISDRGTDSALTPEAGTVQGGDGTSIMDGVSGAVGDVSEGISEFASDMLGTTQNATDTNANTGVGTSVGSDASVVADSGGSVAVTVIIFIIIAVAIVALVLVLVPKRRD